MKMNQTFQNFIPNQKLNSCLLYVYIKSTCHTRSQGGGSRGSDDPPPPWKLISTIKVDILFKNCDNQSPNWCQIWWKSLKNRTFRKYEWNAWKLLDWGFCSKYPRASGGLERPPDPLPRGARLALRVDEPPSGNPCLRACMLFKGGWKSFQIPLAKFILTLRLRVSSLF